MKKSDRQKIFDKYGGRCAYCGIELIDKWQVDHAVSKQYWFMIDETNPKAVNNIENLMPACVPCNHYKGSLCIEPFSYHRGFRNYMKDFHLRLAKLPKKTRVKATENRKAYMQDIADRYGITPDKPFNGIFYFETLTPSII